MTARNTRPEMTLVNALQAAVRHDDLDDACRILQDSMGITDGGLASVCLSDLVDNDPEDDSPSWKDLSTQERHDRLVSYVKSEIDHMDPAEINQGESLARVNRFINSGNADTPRDQSDSSEETEQDFLKFQETRRRMTARDFGAIVKDEMWKNDLETQFLVYEDQWWIEVCDDGRYLLTLENQSWITGAGHTLENLERMLHAFARESEE